MLLQQVGDAIPGATLFVGSQRHYYVTIWHKAFLPHSDEICGVDSRLIFVIRNTTPIVVPITLDEFKRIKIWTPILG